MEEQKIQRINELQRLAKERGLTAEEKMEQQLLREEYVESCKQNLMKQLDRVYMIDEAGNKVKLEKRNKL